jgi:hypothetical protein
MVADQVVCDDRQQTFAGIPSSQETSIHFPGRGPAKASGAFMSLLQKLFNRKPQPGQRIRVCVECGMPIADHKEWCSILRTQREYDRKAAAAATTDPQ